ncbi:hypothetical protein JW979_08885 [bacterium]|nr:hypothetical protein [candidate division CSSED10-310 bacterium]
MRIGLPVWEKRISPVFDSASTMWIACSGSGNDYHWETHDLPEGPMIYRIQKLLQLNIDVLICGAVSRCCLQLLNGYGFQVVNWVCGDADEVVKAFLAGHSLQETHAMPGMRNWGRGFRHRKGRCWQKGRRKQ